ncbi:MAG: dihydropteridine reductase [Ruminococcaceae bacterium]|nr:dihydropteridine reductase [Oscillospiraceae bacterium]
MNRNDTQFMAQKIRAQYMEKQATELDELRKLDAKVKRPANTFAYVLGSIGAMVMGAGMSLVMTDIGDMVGITADNMVLGIIIGVVGLVVAVVNYPIYKGILNSRRKKYAARILELSEKVMNK